MKNITAIAVNNVTKQYSISKRKSGSLIEQLSLIFSQKKDSSVEEFYAVDDVSFEIPKGEVIGIIGKNGAGKSTLLKMLSQITKPSKGRIEINGRIASLLEVGTGFHPELTGRENVFLNGTILGMTRNEVKEKFDEIVAFSGVHKFIDTPVKHYSSGMYVRLAFAVAAHLEPEILIVDEVLAVGDAEFQKKCLGKMKEVAGQGRTVIFVSHNMTAVKNLCSRSILMNNGKLLMFSNTNEVVDYYIGLNSSKVQSISQITERKGNGSFRFTEAYAIQNGMIRNQIKSLKECEIHIYLNKHLNLVKGRIDVGINDQNGIRVAWISSVLRNFEQDLVSNKFVFSISNINFSVGRYYCTLYCEFNNVVEDWVSDSFFFDVVEDDYYGTGKNIPKTQCTTMLNFEINVVK